MPSCSAKVFLILTRSSFFTTSGRRALAWGVISSTIWSTVTLVPLSFNIFLQSRRTARKPVLDHLGRFSRNLFIVTFLLPSTLNKSRSEEFLQTNAISTQNGSLFRSRCKRHFTLKIYFYFINLQFFYNVKYFKHQNKVRSSKISQKMSRFLYFPFVSAKTSILLGETHKIYYKKEIWYILISIRCNFLFIYEKICKWKTLTI